MAELDPAVGDIVDALNESSLAWLGRAARREIDRLPDPVDIDPREAALGQLDTIQKVVLGFVHREMALGRRLGPLAEQLGVSAEVNLLTVDGKLSALNSEDRFSALAKLGGALEDGLNEARGRIQDRFGE